MTTNPEKTKVVPVTEEELTEAAFDELSNNKGEDEDE